jgi:DNA adenine methylase
MGSKQAILPFIYNSLRDIKFTSVLDAFSGSSAVSYLFKSMGKSVYSNDFLHFCYHTANACVANNHQHLSAHDIEYLLQPHPAPGSFIVETFSNLYFSDTENLFLENLVANIRSMKSGYKQSLAYAALVRACLRRRPRGLFTYTGVRYDDGRRDLKISLEQHFRDAIALFNNAVFDNGQTNRAFNSDIFELNSNKHFDLVYIDTPYVSPHSDNDYSRRYHFVEGLVRYWDGLEILEQTSTKKFKRPKSLFDSKKTVYDGFSNLFERFRDSIIVVSYSSNGIPNKLELKSLLSRYKRKVVVYEVDHLYSFGTHTHKVGSNKNAVLEYLFVGR